MGFRWLHTLKSMLWNKKKSQRSPIRRSIFRRLELESLEDRLVPSGIVNGDFNQGTNNLAGWTVTDPTYVNVNSSNQAVISESPIDTEVDLYQDFTVPQGAQTLAFTFQVLGAPSVPSGDTPDAFGASLLNPQSLQPLVNTVNDSTDSYYVQDVAQGVTQGQAASGVTVASGTVSGTLVITLNVSTLDGDSARILFRLIGGSEVTGLGAVGVSDVMTAGLANGPYTAVFSNLQSPTITYGTATTTLSGTVGNSDAGVFPSQGETVDATIDGQLESTTTSDDTGDFSLSFPTSTLPVSGSPYTITYSYGGDENLSTAIDDSTTLTVNAAPITVTANAQTKVYGTSDPALTYQITSGALVGTDQFSGNLTRVAGENVGSYAIQQGTLTAGNNYSLTYIGANLSITAAPITVTANAQTKVYGTSDPALTYQITSGALVGEDQLAGNLTRVAGEDVGTYAIQQGTLTAGDNYDLTYIGANLSITAAPITVTANAQTKVYGTSDPALTYQITSGALVGQDQLTGNLTRVAGEDVGTYAIQQGTLTAGDNYDLTYIGANLSITAAPITVTANAQTKVYGTSDPALTYQITSGALVGQDQLTGNLTRVAGEDVGTYTIQQGTLTAGDNYDLTYVGANLSITAAPITVTANAQTKVYGTSDPALTYQITSGALVGQDQLTGNLTRVAGEDVGTYTIQQGTLTAGDNYDLTYVGANLSITAAPITVTANAQTKVYGTSDPALTYQITSGALVGQDQLTGNLTRVAGEDVGTYTIQQGTLTAGDNYDLTYIGANLSITAAPITVTANAQTKVYGTSDPTLTYQITSGALVGEDQLTGNLSRVAGENVGTYAIQQNTLTAGSNYDLTYVGANLSITAAPITVTANAQTKVEGTSDPALTYQITSGALVGSDQFSGSLTRVAGESVGTYAIQQGTLTAGNNYTLTYVGANLSITAASNPVVATFANNILTLTNTVTVGVTVTFAVSGSTELTLTTPSGDTITATPASAELTQVSPTEVALPFAIGATTGANAIQKIVFASPSGSMYTGGADFGTSLDSLLNAGNLPAVSEVDINEPSFNGVVPLDFGGMTPNIYLAVNVGGPGNVFQASPNGVNVLQFSTLSANSSVTIDTSKLVPATTTVPGPSGTAPVTVTTGGVVGLDFRQAQPASASATAPGVQINLLGGTDLGSYTNNGFTYTISGSSSTDGTNITAIYGSPGNDTITGNNKGDLLIGGGGADNITGGAGNNEIYGTYDTTPAYGGTVGAIASANSYTAAVDTATSPAIDPATNTTMITQFVTATQTGGNAYTRTSYANTALYSIFNFGSGIAYINNAGGVTAGGLTIDLNNANNANLVDPGVTDELFSNGGGSSSFFGFAETHIVANATSGSNVGSAFPNSLSNTWEFGTGNNFYTIQYGDTANIATNDSTATGSNALYFIGTPSGAATFVTLGGKTTNTVYLNAPAQDVQINTGTSTTNILGTGNDPSNSISFDTLSTISPSLNEVKQNPNGL